MALDVRGIESPRMAFTSASLFALPVTKVSGRTAPPERFIFTATKENTKQKKNGQRKKKENNL